MPLLITVIGLVVLILLISYFKLHTFLSFLVVSLGVGLALQMAPSQILQAIQHGMGSTLGSIVSIIALGAMLGKLVAQSGAAQRISVKMMNIIGTGYVRWAFMITGFIVGLPLFYSVGFMLLAPLVITVSYRYKLPAVYIALPMLASLSVTQGYLPPHPAPLALVKQFNVDMGLTLFYGIIVAIPAILISGALFGATVKKYITLPNKAFIAPDLDEKVMPSTFISFASVLLPILLIGISTLLIPYFPENSFSAHAITFVGDPIVSMFISVLFAAYFLGIKQHKKMAEVTVLLGDSVKEVAMLFLIFGGAGALKQVLTEGGVSQSIAGMMQASSMHPLVLAWGMAAIIRVAVGSSTVSGITTAGFVTPLLAATHTEPHLMVLSIGAGSMMFSHVNDAGFWLFREYFQLSMADTLKTWSVMETLVSVSGLAGVMALNAFIG
ncbi:gluconate:H+ symporter [Emticicia sp. 21SJ11W-3]|uniref:gluconate:H+ symporter n=1 Tax=Emticicia sp. 21SJ11W-3 TaxID=2916755 RepID=UPI0020A1D95D|nr:gluconate:H+ symporter [Emticicia sp. 21SJ11W-3]UTA69760.1 GntP family permease [Emticicia sp. 21SJ11W-3]